MPRILNFLKEDEKAVYHVISRTALDGLPFKDVDREGKRLSPPRKHICGKSIQVANDHPATSGCTRLIEYMFT
jgi:hypothetical protein